MNKMDYLFSEDSGDESKLYSTAEEAFSLLEDIYHRDGWYPAISVTRQWSKDNPVISGEIAQPRPFRWYLIREFIKLFASGATIGISPGRRVIPLSDTSIPAAIDEEIWDFSQKKLFLFRPERIELSLDRITHYTGTDPGNFQRYVLFTNYDMHIGIFQKIFPECVRPSREGVQMPAYHHVLDENLGVTIVNIGVGPSNAKTITDHLSVLRPDAMIMVGHCAGLRNHQEIGDFVLASGFMRDDYVLDDLLPMNVPVIPNYFLTKLLQEELAKSELNVRIGTVFTTGNRNWEFSIKRYQRLFMASRCVAIDMESATVVANGFRYRVPAAALLAVSDKPLHGKPKMSGPAQEFYSRSKDMHLQIVLNILDVCRKRFSAGFPNDMIRGIDEPLFGSL